MAKPRIPNQKKQYQLLNRRLAAYMAAVRRIYGELNSEAARIALSTGYDGKQPFAWKDYPATKARVRKLQERFVSQLGGLIMTGTSDEWKRSNLQQDLIVDKVLKAYHTSREDAANERYYRDNSEALQAFQTRKEQGMNLSDKLWDQSQAYREELQDTISAAIERGTDAITLSKQISKYLSDFPAMQRDYKEKYGKASKVQNCEYRSIRLARSEINMAYRSAEQQRWRQLDFVVGYEIKMSGSHPVHDVCDELAGKYPKDFVWNGWHPNCMCYEIPILKTEDEFYSDDDKPSVNEVTDVPEEFKEWCIMNEWRISEAKKKDTLPYFLHDNTEMVDKILKQAKMPIKRIELTNAEKSTLDELENALSDMPKIIERRYMKSKLWIFREFLTHEKYSERHEVVTNYIGYGYFEEAIKAIKNGKYRDADRYLESPIYSIISDTDFFKELYVKIPRENAVLNGVHIDYSRANAELGSYGSVYSFRNGSTFARGYSSYDVLYNYFGGRESIERELSRLSENSSVFMAINGSTLEKKIILGDGRFKNSLETGTGTFTTIGEERAKKERRIFGLDDDADFIALPKYGFMATKGDMDYEPIVGWGYGDCYVEFKPEVKGKATITYGDSYDGNRIGDGGYYTMSAPAVSASHPQAEFLLSVPYNYGKMPSDELSRITSFSELHSRTYIEAQLYGDIRIEDVERIYVESKSKLASIQKAINKQGLDIRVIPARYDTRLKAIADPSSNKKGEAYVCSLLDSDVDALGDFYINNLCEHIYSSYSPVNADKGGDFDVLWISTKERIKNGSATVEEKRTFLKRFYAELDKRDSGAFNKYVYSERKKTYGGWTSDVIDEKMLKRSE